MKNPRPGWLSFRAARHTRNRRRTLFALICFCLCGGAIIHQTQLIQTLLGAPAKLLAWGSAAAQPLALVTSPGPLQSSPLALTPDNQRLLNLNPDANTVTVFNVAGATPLKLAEIAVGASRAASPFTRTARRPTSPTRSMELFRW